MAEQFFTVCLFGFLRIGGGMHYWRSCSRPFPAMSSANNACYVCTDLFRACAYAVLF